ncbi:MAG: efflux RND transporter periplasmic adaptor subunit [Prolixibacteraceae bacterium]
MKKQIIIFTAVLTGGIFIGWLLFHSAPKMEAGPQTATEENKSAFWTCAMHPQIRKSEAGLCPICAMELIPLSQSGGTSVDPATIHFTKEAAQLANLQTTVVSSRNPVKEVRLYGKVQADERLIQSQVSYIPGRIEKLLINFTGETVRKGQILAVIYSPDLVTSQQELIEAAKTQQAQPEIFEAAKEKLRQWKLTEQQINSIVNSGQVKSQMDITSTVDGVVISRRVNNGDYVSQGTVLYEVSNLSEVWVQFEAYESDLQFLAKGNKVDFSFQALPGENYSGNIVFIDPSIDPVTRIAKLRVEISNRSGKLKPEMFASGIVKSGLEEFRDKLVIPRSAVLWTGKRSVVYVKVAGKDPVFKIREIGLGPQLGNSYVVTDGLTDGEEIVTEGAFSIDAAAQLEGKPSMMNRDNPSVEETSVKQTSELQLSNSEIPTSSLSFHVSGNCEMCKERIESTAKSVIGVASAEWSAGKRLLQVSFDPAKTNSEAIQLAISKSGHDTEKFKAPDEVYLKLPECCLYRK